MGDVPNYDLLWQWCAERESVRIKRERGEPPPWTDDPVIANYRFCNVRREDDVVTIWIRENIRKPFADHPHLWLMLCAARIINHPDTLAWLMDSAAWPSHPKFTPHAMTLCLNAWQTKGEKIYTGAYMIPAPHQKGADKQEYIAEKCIGALWERQASINKYLAQVGAWAPTMKGMHERVSAAKGFGPFLAYQAVVDMRFTKILENAPDIETWWAAGPGTLRGLNRLHGRPLKPEISQAQARTELRKLWLAVKEWGKVTMDATDVPNICCEYDKWMRVRNGEGKPRAGYAPKAPRHGG